MSLVSNIDSGKLLKHGSSMPILSSRCSSDVLSSSEKSRNVIYKQSLNSSYVEPQFSEQNNNLPWNKQRTIMSGYLIKSKGKYGWHKYWVVLRNNQIITYKDESEYKPLTVINLSNIISIIELTKESRVNVFGMFSHKKVFYFQAFSTESLKDWIRAIYSCSPFNFRKRFTNRTNYLVP